MDVPLWPVDGFKHRFCGTVLRSTYRMLFGAVWRHGKRVPLHGPVLIVSNHPTYLDPLGIYMGSPRRIFWMAWAALFQAPGMGRFIAANGAFPVDNLTTDVHALRTATRLLKEGHAVGVFPEGGRGLADGEMLPFLTGPFRMAVRLGCPVVPVTVNGGSRCWPRTHSLPKLGPGLRYVYHAPLFARSGKEGGTAQARAEELAMRTRERILSAYDVPSDVLDRSRRTPLLSPDEHPIFRADREGVPFLEWLARRENTNSWRS